MENNTIQTQKAEETKKTGRIYRFFTGDWMIEGIERQLGFIFFVFVIFCGIIFWSLMVESRLVQVVENTHIIDSLGIARDQKALDLLGLDSRGSVEELLEKNNSKLKAPVLPPIVIEE